MTTRYRPHLWQLPWMSLLPSFGNLVFAPGPQPRSYLARFYVPLLVFGVVVLVRVARMGVDLTPEGLVVRGFRHRLLPWSDVVRIYDRSSWGTHTVRVVTPSKTWTLRAPLHTRFVAPDREYHAKLEAIRLYWLEHTDAATVWA